MVWAILYIVRKRNFKRQAFVVRTLHFSFLFFSLSFFNSTEGSDKFYKRKCYKLRPICSLELGWAFFCKGGEPRPKKKMCFIIFFLRSFFGLVFFGRKICFFCLVDVLCIRPFGLMSLPSDYPIITPFFQFDPIHHDPTWPPLFFNLSFFIKKIIFDNFFYFSNYTQHS